jgi:hypothetical protein
MIVASQQCSKYYVQSRAPIFNNLRLNSCHVLLLWSRGSLDIIADERPSKSCSPACTCLFSRGLVGVHRSIHVVRTIWIALVPTPTYARLTLTYACLTLIHARLTLATSHRDSVYGNGYGSTCKALSLFKESRLVLHEAPAQHTHVVFSSCCSARSLCPLLRT